MTARSLSAILTAMACLAALSSMGCFTPHQPDAICDDGSCAFSPAEWKRLQGLTNLGPPPRDLSNSVDGLPAAIELGRAFFNDARFSGPATQIDALRRPAAVARAPLGESTNLSCASCHDLARAGADTASVPGNVSSGAGWSDVNALAIVNSAYQHLFTWNGRADSLWSQAFAVAENPTTMNGNRLHTFHVIIDNYGDAYDNIFGIDYGILGVASLSQLSPHDPRFPPDGKPGAKEGCNPADSTEPFGDAWDCMAPLYQEEVTYVLIRWAKALAAYEATLTSRHAVFDVFMQEGPGSSAISAAAKRGARLFVSKAGCIDCHNTPLFSDGDFHNVGVLQAGPDVPTEADCPSGGACDCVTPPAGKGCLPWGALDGLTKLQASKTLRSSMYSDETDDTSRADELTRPLTSALEGAWRTPTLRNVALTAPYMHDGVYGTLEEVVAHYNRGGDPGAPGVRAVQIRPLGLTDGEQADLVAFLQTLSETSVAAGAMVGSHSPDASVMGADASQAASACQGIQPQTSLITGSASSPAGPVFALAGDNLGVLGLSGVSPPPCVMELPSTGGTRTGVRVFLGEADLDMGPAPAFWGFGLSFTNPGCLDARVFTGVRFTVSGDLGSCELRFGVVPSEDDWTVDSPFGSCSAYPCISPLSGSIGIGTTVVRFSEMIHGSPQPTPDLAALNAVEWVLATPAGSGLVFCQANITVSDVAFVVDDGDSMPPTCTAPLGGPCEDGAACVAPGPGTPGSCMKPRVSCVGGNWMPVPCAQ